MLVQYGVIPYILTIIAFILVDYLLEYMFYDRKACIPCFFFLGHEIPPSNSGVTIPDPKKNPDLYTLKGQVEHKLRFIEKYVPDSCDLYLVGHSIGSKIISELLKDGAMTKRVSVKRSVFLFPTIQKMRETPNGRKIIFTTSYFLSITIFLSWVRHHTKLFIL